MSVLDNASISPNLSHALVAWPLLSSSVGEILILIYTNASNFSLVEWGFLGLLEESFPTQIFSYTFPYLITSYLYLSQLGLNSSAVHLAYGITKNKVLLSLHSEQICPAVPTKQSIFSPLMCDDVSVLYQFLTDTRPCFWALTTALLI